MKNLSAILRNLADVIDANGGRVPEVLLKKDERKSPGQTYKPKSPALSIAKKHFYGSGKNR